MSSYLGGAENHTIPDIQRFSVSGLITFAGYPVGRISGENNFIILKN